MNKLLEKLAGGVVIGCVWAAVALVWVILLLGGSVLVAMACRIGNSILQLVGLP